MSEDRKYEVPEGVAIIGMAGQFPGARDLEEFWRNLRNGVESIVALSEDEVLAAGLRRESLEDPRWVKAAARVADVDLFDAHFFGLPPRQAEILDPQQRRFLQVAWHALENAGYDSASYGGRVGVFASGSSNSYVFNLMSRPELVAEVSPFAIRVGNEKDYVATRTSFALGLSGPSIGVQSACSSTLVALHLACESVLNGESDLALAGGVSLSTDPARGYLYAENGIFSRDGHCRPFDAEASGTVFGGGIGVVVLKNLEDALRDGDTVRAVVRGSAVNNDGSVKVGYTAPGVQGQQAVIADALAESGVDPRTISYVEAHGTGTPLGDPIEIRALSQAFQGSEGRADPCAIGSVKSNIGHADTAAGIAGLIKTVMALENRQLPPTLNFKKSNPQIDFESTPFKVYSELRDWPAGGSPRRAGVSSFGIGGTNAHAILEEAPPPSSGSPSRPWQLLLLSARMDTALDAVTANLAAHLRRHPEIELADVAHTLMVGRRHFEHRRTVVCRDREDALAVLAGRAPARGTSSVLEGTGRPPVAFLFPGQGAQYAGMAAGLHRDEPAFRDALEDCLELLTPDLAMELRRLLVEETGGEGRDERLAETEIAQPALFVVEYSLARLLRAWGISPRAMVGHSLGEYVAACLAGVFSLADALALVAERGRLIQELPRGSMLSVLKPAAEVEKLLGDRLALAAVNGRERTVISGPTAAVEAFEKRLVEQGVSCRRLRTSHAFHSPMMDPILAPFTERVREVERKEPRIPFVSNLTGTWIRPEEAVDPRYWALHLRRTVLFDRGLEEVLGEEGAVLLEVGPGRSLGTLARRHTANVPRHRVLATLPGARDRGEEQASVLAALGRLWEAGAAIDAAGLFARESRRRIPLPGYPFEEKRYWIGPPTAKDRTRRERAVAAETTSGGLYVPRWSPMPAPVPWTADDDPESGWLIFLDEGGLGERLAGRLRSADRQVVTVAAAEDFATTADGVWLLRPGRPEDYERLLSELAKVGPVPRTVVHLFGWAPEGAPKVGTEIDRGFFSLLFLAQAQARQAPEGKLRLCVVASGLHRVNADDRVVPVRATVLGPVRVLALEVPGLRTIAVDLPASQDPEEATDHVLAEIASQEPEGVVAYRAGERRVLRFEAWHPTDANPEKCRLRTDGVYLITGGFGGLGSTFAEYLARDYQARLILVGRSVPPPRERWDAWLAKHAGDPVATGKIALIRRLEELGAKVIAVAADIAEGPSLRAALTEARDRFGEIQGVIHAAGVAGGEPAHRRSRDAAAAVLRPKVQGTLALAEVLEGTDLDFLVLCSSTAAILGALGQVDYAAANAFLDAFAHSAVAPPGTVAIDWDAWHGTGMADGEMRAGSIRPEDGLSMLQRILSGAAPGQIVACRRDLPALVEHSRELLRTASSPSGLSNPARSSGHSRPEISSAFVAPRNDSERRIARVWEKILGLEGIGVDDMFFDLGGDSLLLMAVRNKLREKLGVEVTMAELFRYPTVAALARHLRPVSESVVEEVRKTETPLSRTVGASIGRDPADIAIVGMSGRFPGSPDLETFWCNLREGKELISFFTDDELTAEGIAPSVLASPRYVKALPLLEGGDRFDAGHFGIHPREAETIDPQQRIFLETAWEALENAGYAPDGCDGIVGVFAGAGVSRYWLNIASRPDIAGKVGVLQLVLGNDKDHLPTRVSFKLDLKGPSVNVQTACSTSLVAVHLACRNLLDGECDMALAGGVALAGPGKGGYICEEGGILSPDGHCRPFDARGRGTVFGSGSGAVVLKRLADALADGDTVHAVVKGSAINNDGAGRVGYTAPGVEGQAQVIQAALRAAGVWPETIDYVEAHGTATPLGDPIEVAALREAFGPMNGHVCALGSVKSNIGHADAAAGIAGLFKCVLAMQHREIPPSLHFEEPNPEIDFESGPFYVHDALAPWPEDRSPRRAGVSAFGMGGTNAHVVLEEAPKLLPSGPATSWHLLVLSARSRDLLDRSSARLAHFLEEHPETNLADVAYTLKVGRKAFAHRRVLVCRNAASAVQALDAERRGRDVDSPAAAAAGTLEGPWTRIHDGHDRAAIFLFPGQGSQYPDMGLELYRELEVFRREVDRCCELLEPSLELDLREVLYPSLSSPGPGTESAERLQQTALAQPALFVTEYALARQWMSWGVRPEGMAGHSIGEFVAACLCGVFSLADALALVAARGRLMQKLPAGAMLSVPLNAEALDPLLPDGVCVAAINAPDRCVASGPHESVETLATRLRERKLPSRRLHTSHAFHSPMMDPILEPFRRELQALELHAPRLPFLSNTSGTWITEAEATDREYWVRHLREPVLFSRIFEELFQTPDRVVLEVGPGRTLGALAGRCPEARDRPPVISSMPPAVQEGSALALLLAAQGRLWQAGGELSWKATHSAETRRRLPLPTTPFDRQRYWIEKGDAMLPAPPGGHDKKVDIADWFYVPVWKPSATAPSPIAEQDHGTTCLLFVDESELSARFARRLEDEGRAVIRVEPGEDFARIDDQRYAVAPARRADYDALLQDLDTGERFPQHVVHLWGVTPDLGRSLEAQDGDLFLSRGFYSVLYLAQALEDQRPGDQLQLLVVTSGVQRVRGDETIVPEKATVLGPCTVLPQEYPDLRCRAVDVESRAALEPDGLLLDQLADELRIEASELAVAYRSGIRWTETWESLRLSESRTSEPRLRPDGCYLVTGGLGGLGSSIARGLVDRHPAELGVPRLILTGRSVLPPRSDWETWLAEHGDDDPASRKLRLVLDLEESGAEVEVLIADVADRGRMEAGLAKARERFGAIHGVIHAAGVAAEGLTQHKAPANVERVLRPKVTGTRVLESLLAGTPLDFFALFSSSAVLLGGLGTVDYTAANAFLDAFAQAGTRAAKHTVAIDWGAWQEVGMATAFNLGFGSEEEHRAFLSRSILPREGIEAFHRILGRRLPRVLVWTMDLETSIRERRLQAASQRTGGQEAGPRPELETEYVEPRDATESELAALWGDLLGIGRVGILDNVFEIGADSLVATRMLSRIRREMGVSLKLQEIFEAPSVAALASVIAGRSSNGPDDLGDLEELFSRVESMSEHEVDEVLSRGES